MRFPPELFLIGAQKSGTTFLANLLDEHPGITLSNPKEPGYFTGNWDKGIEWYSSKFSGPENNILIDASTSYSAGNFTKTNDNTRYLSHYNDVPEKIHSVSPNAKFIYLLRDPVSRAYSSYWHDVRNGLEKKPFRKAINDNSYYLRVGYYAKQIRLYLELFPMENFLILLFEDLKQDPVGTANRCFRFIGLKEHTDLNLGRSKHTSYSYRGWLNIINVWLAKSGGLKKIISLAKSILPDVAHKPITRLITKEIPRIDENDRKYLVKYYLDKNRELEELTGVSIEKWAER